MSIILEFLNRPYPFSDNLNRNAKVVFFISLTVFVLLLLFQPLQINQFESKTKVYLILSLGILTFLSLSLNLSIIPALWPQLFLKRQWKIWKEIVWNFWIFFTITASYLISYKVLGILDVDISAILKLNLIAIIPITILIGFNQNFMLRLRLKTATELNNKLNESKVIREKMVHFASDSQNETFSIRVQQLCFIRSADNYIEIFWKEAETIKRQIIRSSLLKAQEILKEFSFVMKCHRSYLVNINFIEKVEGNSQGYKLFFNQIDFEIPVSRNAIDDLKDKIKHL
jgi:hypothetical protein